MKRHFHGDNCPSGHRYRDRFGEWHECIHESWDCDHCHDDPPPGHECPACGRKAAVVLT